MINSAIETSWSGYYLITRDPADRDYNVLRMIPGEYWDELEHLLISCNKLAEINSFIIYPEVPEDIRHFYFEKIAKWRDAGVKFTYGSDLHASEYNFGFRETFEKLLAEYGFTADDFALPEKLKISR